MRRRYRDLPIHAKLLVPFAILMITWGGFGAGILVHGTASEARGRATARLSAAFDGARATLSEGERNLLETVRLAANTDGVGDAIVRGDARTLKALLEPIALNAGHDGLRVVDTDGDVVVAVGLSATASDPAIVRAARGERDARGDKFASLTKDELLVAGPVKHGAKTVGAVVASDGLARLAARMGRGTGARVVLFTPNGAPLAANGAPLDFRNPGPSGLHQKVGDVEALYGPLDVRGERAGVVAVAFPSNVLLAGAGQKTLVLAVLVGVAVVVALGIGLLTARAVTKPVDELVAATRALGEGDLAARVQGRGSDEIGALAASFNAMAADLETAHRDLEQKVAERTAELHRANTELTQINVAKSAFLATLSHELRTPLNGIIGFADMLADPVFGEHSPDETRVLAGNILASGQHLLRLINDLLDLAKIEAGKIDIQMEAVDVSTVVAEVHTVMQPMAREKRTAMHVDFPQRVPRVVADPARLRQVLINLVSNAIKFTPEGGRVRIAADARDGTVAITVTDDGPGLRQDEIARIFEPYERGDAGLGADGAGLGLALARLLIEHMNGTIWVESVPGAGSTFGVNVPVAARPAHRRGAKSAGTTGAES